MRRRAPRPALALAGWAVVSLAAATPAPPSVERRVEASGPGRAAVTLDRDVYERARADLGDVRVVDEAGVPVPYVLERAAPEADGDRVLPSIRDRGFSRGRSESLTLDFGRPFAKRDLVLSLSGDNFRRRVAVEASDDGESWTTVTDGTYIFAVPGTPSARYESIPLGEDDRRYLRVTVFHGPDDPERIEIRQAWAHPSGPPTPPLVDLGRPFARYEDPERHETLLVLDLGARHQPFEALLLDVADPRFFRGVVVEGRRDPPADRPGEPPSGPYWVAVGEAAVYRYGEAGGPRESLRIAVSGRERALRVRIRNRDDRPLDVRRVGVFAPVERVLFEVAPGRSYRLTYGSADLRAPSYDLARTLGGDLGAWASSARSARLGAPQSQEGSTHGVPWTERHPGLVWCGLLVVVGRRPRGRDVERATPGVGPARGAPTPAGVAPSPA